MGLVQIWTEYAIVTWHISYLQIIITGRNEVLAKVMFLHLSVILLTGGEYLTRNPPRTREVPPRDQTHPPQTRQEPPPPGTADSGIRSTFGRYASYWNAFLSTVTFTWHVYHFHCHIYFCFSGACVVGRGDVCGCWGACGCQGGMCGCGGACMVAGGHVAKGGVRGCRGACMVARGCA